MSYIVICVVFLIGIISIPNILGQSDEINNNIAMEHHQKYVSSNIIDKYFNNNTLVHQKDFVNNLTLHYVIGGQGDPILLLHGWPETWYEWRHIIPELISSGLNTTIIGKKIIHFRSVQLLTGEDLMTLEDVTLPKQLEEKLLQMSKVFMESIDPILVRDLDGKIVDLNRAAEQTYGWSREELLGKSFKILVPPDRHENVEETHERCKRGDKVANVEALYHTKSGEIIPVLLSLSLLTNEKGEPVGMAAISKNLSDLKRTEDMLRSQTKALERSNKDLEEFAYVAAHDLREPLIGIGAYVKILQRQYRERLDAPAHKFIFRTLDTINRMDCLIQSLLSYSRLGTDARQLEPTDCSMALADALSNLRSAIEASGARVMCDPLPTVMANPPLLVQLFQNLVSNAIKFAGDEPLEIRIGIQRQESEWLFSVRDNGIGIEPPHFDRIFRIFQRIESGADRPGTGIGLANCKKIVEHHGGRIWVESTPGTGSIFFFTMPVLTATGT